MRKLLRDLTPGQDYLLAFRYNDGENVSDWSPTYQFRTDGDVTPPADPLNVEWKPTGESFLATWDSPTLDGNGKVLKDFKHFEITAEANGKSKVYTTTATTWELNLVMNAEAFGGIELTVKITIKSVDNTGNKSNGISKTATEDTPPIPSVPIISNNMGLLVVEWDGKTSLGTINPFNLQYIEIHASKIQNFTPSDTTIAGRFEGWATGSQKTVLPNLDYGDKYYFKLVSVNKKIKKSPPSPQAEGTAARISGLDIEDGAISVDQINFADQLGGGRAWYDDVAPSTGVNDGDTWFDSNDKNHMYVRVAGQWVDARDAAISDAITASNQAVTAANGKNRIYPQPNQPTGGTYINGDTWFDTDDGNKPYTYINGTWTNMRDATIAAAQTAANNATTLASGKNRVYYQPSQPTGGTYVNGDMWFDTDDKNKPYIYANGTWSNARDAAISDVEISAGNAQSAANAAAIAAQNAQVAADAAATAAETADANALAASGLAGSKGKVWYQTTAPAGNSNDLWIDTTGGANTPKRWNGSAWVAVTDKTATDAAAAATTAKNAADAAQGTANTAVTNAQTAQNRADAAHGLATTANTTANGKNAITYSTGAATGSGTRAGDIWFQRNASGVIIGQWEWTGSAWQARTLDNAVIANLDAGKLTAGTISADRIAAGTITTEKLAADSVTADKIAANAVTATEILAGSINTAHMTANTINGDRIQAGTLSADKIVANSIGAGQIAAGAITADEINALAVTTAKLAANSVTAEKILAGAVTADKILAGAVTAEKINAGAVTADKIGTNQIITSSANIGTAVIDAANIASINAATITTGTMQSSLTSNYGGVDLPSWSINMNGMANFSEARIYGQLIVGSSNAAVVANNSAVSIRSYNYLPNAAGWTINGDGTVEFGSATMRGSFRTNTTGRRVEILSGGTSGEITFYAPTGLATKVQSYSSGSWPFGLETIAMRIPTANVYGGWNAFQLQSDQSAYLVTKFVNMTYGGDTTNGGGFFISHATDRGTSSVAPQLDTRMDITEVNGTRLYDNGNKLRLWLSNDGGFQLFDGSDSTGDGDLRFWIGEETTNIYGPAGINSSFQSQPQFSIQRGATIIRGRTTITGDDSYVSVTDSGVPGSSARMTFVNRNNFGGLIKYYYIAGDTGGPRIEIRGADDAGFLPVWATSFVVNSDRETKRQITDVSFDALEMVKKMRGRKYLRKGYSGGKNNEGVPDIEQFGFVTDELPKELVKGDPSSDQASGIDVMAVITALVGSIQKIDERLTAMEARIAEIDKKKK